MGNWIEDIHTQTKHTSYLSRKPREFSCIFFLAGVNFYRFNAKNWQFTVYFAVIAQKIDNFLCILSEFTRFFGVNFILQKFCSCKKMTNMRYGQLPNQIVFVLTIFLENGEIYHSDVLIYTDVILIWFQGALNNVPVVNNPGLNILLGALKGAKRNQFHQHTFTSTKRNCDR